MRISHKIIISNLAWVFMNLIWSIINLSVPIRYPVPKFTEFWLSIPMWIIITCGTIVWIITFITLSYISKNIKSTSANSANIMFN